MESSWEKEPNFGMSLHTQRKPFCSLPAAPSIPYIEKYPRSLSQELLDDFQAKGITVKQEIHTRTVCCQKSDLGLLLQLLSSFNIQFSTTLSI